RVVHTIIETDHSSRLSEIWPNFIFYQVLECMDKLAQAGIKIWVLSGDKMETTINIGLRRQGMKQLIITLESPEIIAAKKGGDKAVLSKVSTDGVKNQILAGKAQLTASTT
ncbi:hypothetical protein M8C21_006149, partial [Ambrosia artemisiifolia]